MKVLFYIEPLTERDRPAWKAPWIGFVELMVESLRRDFLDFEFLCIVGDGLENQAKKRFGDSHVACIRHTELVPKYGDSALSAATNWYRGAPDETLQSMGDLLKTRISPFIPNICISFSSAPFAKIAFDNIPVLYFELALYSRSPFPMTAYLDPLGMFCNSYFYKNNEKLIAYCPTNSEVKLVKTIRELYVSRISQENILANLVKPILDGFDSSILVALQFSQFYAYDAHAQYKDQYDLIIQVLTELPETTAVIVVEHPQYQILSEETLDFLQKRYKNFIWLPEFRSLPSASQYIMEFIDCVVTVSSSVGLQSMLWKKPLIVLGHSHLDTIADAHTLSEFTILITKPWPDYKERVLAWHCSRYTIPFELLFEKGVIGRRISEAITLAGNKNEDYNEYFDKPFTDVIDIISFYQRNAVSQRLESVICEVSGRVSQLEFEKNNLISSHRKLLTGVIGILAIPYSSVLKSQLASSWYFAQNPGLAEAGIDSYDHWLRYGKDEGRLPSDDLVSLVLALAMEREMALRDCVSQLRTELEARRTELKQVAQLEGQLFSKQQEEFEHRLAFEAQIAHMTKISGEVAETQLRELVFRERQFNDYIIQLHKESKNQLNLVEEAAENNIERLKMQHAELEQRLSTELEQKCSEISRVEQKIEVVRQVLEDELTSASSAHSWSWISRHGGEGRRFGKSEPLASFVLSDNSELNRSNRSNEKTSLSEFNLSFKGADLRHANIKNINELLALFDEEFVKSAYSVLLKRYPDDAGLAYYLGRVRDGASKEEIVFQLATSNEGKKIRQNLDGLADFLKIWKRFDNPVIKVVFGKILHGGALGKRVRKVENSLYLLNCSVNTSLKSVSDDVGTVRLRTDKHINEAYKDFDACSIGIHIHAYYIDISDELISAVAKIPVEKHIYISTCDSANIKILTDQLLNNGIRQEFFTLSVVPNRGRNFGPMLVEFRNHLRKHDLILHLHTKKSLRTGVEQISWRKNSWMSLCGSDFISTKIISEFIKNTKLGVIGPTPQLDFSSYWWKAWLSVGHLLSDYFRNLGINEYPKRGMIQFPIGSMFWARTEAIFPLLNHNWKYEDFPEEPCPDDGTIAHVIERSIGAICQHQGFDYKEAEVSVEGDVSIFSPPLLMADYRIMVDRIKHPPHEKIISFDFFDTLFTRHTLTPEDVQHYVGFNLKHGCGVYNGDLFFKFRKEAESAARRKKPSGEVGINEIYASFTDVSNWNNQLIDFAKNKEIEIEKITLKPRLDVINFARKAKKMGARVIVVSDTYFSSDLIREILNQWGLSEQFDEIYVSCEALVRKDWGSMWPKIFSSERLSHWDENFIHLGDNEQSDVQQPIRNGIRALGLLNPAVMYEVLGCTLPIGWKTGRSDWGAGVVLGPVVAKVCNSPLIEENCLPNVICNAKDLGYIVFGPILFGFCKWLIEISKVESGLHNLAFVARDGWYLKLAYDRICEKLPRGAFVPSIYLKASRQAIFASSDNFDELFDLIVGCGEFKGKVRDFFIERLAFDIGDKHDDLYISSISEGGESLIAIFNMYRNEMVGYASNNRTGLLNHLNAIDFRVDGSSALVDLGYSGTIQLLMQKILKSKLTGYYFALNKKAENLEFEYGGGAYGCFGDGRDQNKPMSCIQAYSMLLEAIFSAPHGKVTGYSPKGDPIFRSRIQEIDNSEFSAEVIEGCFDYIDDLMKQYGVDILNVPCNIEVFTLPFSDLVAQKFVISNNLRKNIQVEDDFCGNGMLNALELYNIKTGASMI